MKSGGNPKGQWMFFVFLLIAIAAAVIVTRLSDREPADAATSVETWSHDTASAHRTTTPPAVSRMLAG